MQTDPGQGVILPGIFVGESAVFFAHHFGCPAEVDLDVAHPEGKFALLAVIKIVVKRTFDGWKGYFVPWYFFFSKQATFQAFFANAENTIFQMSPEHQVYLIDVADIEKSVKIADIHGCGRLFKSFPGGSFWRGFPVFHEACRERPEAPAWLDGATAEQYLVFPNGQAAADDLRIFIVDGMAVITHMARAGVTYGGALYDRVAALTAEVHAGLHMCRMSQVYPAHPLIAWA